jgi:transposase
MLCQECKKKLVEVPIGEGVHVKVAGAKNEKYVYKYTKYFRNADGKPRNKAVLIGKLDTESEKMTPNGSYYEFFNVDPEMGDTFVWDYGFAYLVRKCAEGMGILKCLTVAFDAKAMDILVAAAYIMREGNAMDGIDDWLERTYFDGFTKTLNSQSASRLFESVSESKAHEFFKGWVETALGDGNVCYDVTSVSSYSQTMTDVEYGYNRDCEDLPQFNLGLFADESTKLPLYYNRYNGSLTDKTNLSYVLEYAKSVGISDVKFVVDGGFINEDSFQNLSKHAKSFTIGIPASLNISEEMLETHSQGIEKYTNKLDGQEIYCVEKMTEYYGVDGRLMLFYDSMAHAQLCNEMSGRIRLLSAELSGLKRYPKNKLKRYSQYFIITKHATGGGFDFETDDENIDKLRFRKGFFLIFSTDWNATHDDILYHYRAKDAAEKLFDQMKIDMQGNRIRTHNEQTTNGKTFVTFIALAIRTFMLSKLKQFLSDNSFSLKKVFNQLENITIITSSTKGRFTKALTKKQKDILSAFGFQTDIIRDVEFCLR